MRNSENFQKKYSDNSDYHNFKGIFLITITERIFFN